MKEGNDTLKTIATIGGVGVVAYIGYKYFDRQKELETIKSQTAIVKSETINAAKDINPLIKKVSEEIKKNPKSQSYSIAEYKSFASSLFEYFKNKNIAGLITIFDKVKTNTDLMLLIIYYGVRVFKEDNFYSEFKINSYNLSQSIANLAPQNFALNLNIMFKKKGITYQL